MIWERIIATSSSKGTSVPEDGKTLVTGVPWTSGGGIIVKNNAETSSATELIPFYRVGPAARSGKHLKGYVGAMENARLTETLAHKEDVLRQLVTKLITDQEDERKRVASEIQDGVIQALIGIGYSLQGLALDAGRRTDGLSEKLNAVGDSLYQQIQAVRASVCNLRPMILDSHGLGPAIRSLLHSYEEEHHLPIEFALEGDGPRLAAASEITLYRIVQEALANVVEHAQATRIQVKLSVAPEQTVLVVRDNGVGFDALGPKQSFSPQLGLAGIRERVLLLGGQVLIESLPGKGTTITVTVSTGHSHG